MGQVETLRAPHPRLRAWRDEDLPAFTAMHADPEVGRWLGGVLDEGQSAILFNRLRQTLEQQGWGIWAIQDDAGAAVGAAGLSAVGEAMPAFPGVEAVWRLSSQAWGRGYVTEPMQAVLADAFDAQGLEEVVAYTAASNLRSQAVMARLGFARDEARDFDHPRLEPDHPLRRHVFYFKPRPAGDLPT